MPHPQMLDGGYHLVATDREGNALYGFRNFRSGGRHFRMRTPEGKVRDWTHYGVGRTSPDRAPAGRWRWNDLKELYA